MEGKLKNYVETENLKSDFPSSDDFLDAIRKDKNVSEKIETLFNEAWTETENIINDCIKEHISLEKKEKKLTKINRKIIEEKWEKWR